MTEQLANLYSRAKLRRRLATRPVTQHAAPKLHVLVRVPPDAAAHGPEVARRLVEVFESTCTQVGLPKEATIEVDSSESSTFEVSVDARPVAAFRWASKPSVDAVVEATHWALLRRLPVLLHEDDVARLSPRLHLGRADRSREVLEYLLGAGIGLGRLAALPQRTWPVEMSVAEVAEILLGDLPASVRVAVPRSILADLDEIDSGAVGGLRRELQSSLGADFPDIELTIEDAVSPPMRVFLNDVGGQLTPVAAETDWRALVRTLRGLLLDHVSWFVRLGDVIDQKTRVAIQFHDLVEISDLNISDAELAACVRCLLANRDSVRSLPRILWQLIEASNEPGQPDEVLLAEPQMVSPEQSTVSLHPHPEISASEVRRGVAYEDWSGGEVRVIEPRMVCVPEEAETTLVTASDSVALGAAEWSVVRLVQTHGADVVVAHSVGALSRLRQALYCVPERPRAIASRELPPDRFLPKVIGSEEASG